MKTLIYSMIVSSVIIFIISCGKPRIDEEPFPQLQVEPIPNVYIQYESQTNMFWIGNELIERRILINPEKRLVYTVTFFNKLSGLNYLKSPGEEFSFRANGVKLSGITGDLQFTDYNSGGFGGVQTLEMNFQVTRDEIGILKVRLVYEIYSSTPVIRKWIEIENPGGSTVIIDSIQVESLNVVPGSGYVEAYNGSKSIESDDASISPIMFNPQLAEGFRVGNESPGVLKYTILDTIGGSVSIGMKPNIHVYAPEIQLAPQEKFISPAVFILFFKGEISQSKAILEKFVFQHLLTKKSKHSIWYENIGDELTESEVINKIQLAARTGADVFCLDGKWMDKRGDWLVREDINMSNLRDQARSMKMKLGLSMDLAVVDLDSQILADHPTWVLKSKDNTDYVPMDGMGGKMMCLASEYAMYMAYEADALVKELSLDYIRFTGPMLPDEQSGGCYSQDHLHRSSDESLWYIYEGFFAIGKYLRSKHPDLIIQVSPKSYDPGDNIDYALLKNTDMEWQF